MPGTPSMSAGNKIPCQWIDVSTESALRTRSVTRSPSRQRRIGAGRTPFTMVATDARPVMLTAVSPIVSSKSDPANVAVLPAALAPRTGAQAPTLVRNPAATAPCTNCRRVGCFGLAPLSIVFLIALSKSVRGKTSGDETAVEPETVNGRHAYPLVADGETIKSGARGSAGSVRWRNAGGLSRARKIEVAGEISAVAASRTSAPARQ